MRKQLGFICLVAAELLGGCGEAADPRIKQSSTAAGGVAASLAAKEPPMVWDCEKGTNIKWVAELGSRTYGTPAVAQGIVWVGTDNEGHKDPAEVRNGGALMAFREGDGRFLWQRVSLRPMGGHASPPSEGICGTPVIEGDFLYYGTNRCELVCLDISALVKGTGLPREVWVLDMAAKLGVFPHWETRSSPVVWGDFIYLITGNGVDETHKHLPAPNAPSIVCANKKTGEVVWSSNAPGERVLHGQWSTPAIAMVKDRALVIAGLGDGWVYAFDAKSGKIIWKFDGNLKETVYPATKNEILGTPVIVGTRMYLAMGQDPEHGEGPGRIFCVDITKEGDVSAEILAPAEEREMSRGDEALEQAMGAKKGAANPNSAAVWTYAVDKGVVKVRTKERMNRSVSTVAVKDGLVFAADYSGYLHCFDADSGEQYWKYDMEGAIYGSPMVANGKVFLADEAGHVRIFAVEKERKVLADLMMKQKNGDEFDECAVYTTPVFANGVLYLAGRERLFAIGK